MKHERLWQAYKQSPNVRLRNELFLRYFDWAVRVAASVPFLLPDGGLQRDDMQGLVAEELLGCIERFDPSRGIEFEGFARKRVRGVVLNAIETELKHVKGKVKIGAEDGVVSGRFQEATTAIENLVIEVLLENFISDTDYSPDGILFRDSGLAHILESALAGLTKQEFAAIHAHHFGEERKSEVAGLLGVSKGRVSQLLAAAYRKLRSALLRNADADSFL